MTPTKYLSWFFAQNQSIKFAMILSLILIIAYIDYVTPAEMSIRIFYLVPLFLSVWDGNGIIAGLYFSIICTFVYFYGESLQSNLHWHGFNLIWEFMIVWGYFIVFVVSVDKIKKFTLLLSIKNEELNKSNEELEKVNNQKDKFFSTIAHDLRSPFQGFLGITQNMAENADSYSAQELSTVFIKMHQTADNLFNLLRNLLEWAQMQKGSMSFQPKEFSLSDLIAENVQTLKKRSEQKGIAIINTAAAPIQAYADERMINSILLNLISNAVKFTNRNGTVTISTNKTDEEIIEISVSDTGIGMAKSSVEKLFRVGEKIRSIGTDGELSTGLGLLLCKEFVEKHGGKIWVKSQQDIGSSFYFTLPSSNKP
jgi:signal transduction histidine kinase